VVCKAPYRSTSDTAVERRLAEGQWGWYRRDALKTVIQACGRVVRAPDDHGATYLADSSLLDLFDRARGDLPDWFADQVDRMSPPDLPPVDAAAALAGVPESPGGTGGRPAAGRSRSGPPGSSTSDRSSTTADRSVTDEGENDHPLSDVWGDG
jgi:hypothetical protein